MAPPVARGSILHCKLDRQLHPGVVRCMVSARPEAGNGDSGSVAARHGGFGGLAWS
jgi:hypothetical protein